MTNETTNNYDLVPGTVHLVDIEGTLHVKKNGDIILQPQPTSNPNDPLSWSRSRRIFQFSVVWIWGFFVATAINWIGPMFGVWEVELGITIGQFGVATALGFLFLGVGVLIIQPTALKLVGSQATSISSIYAFKSLCGIATSPCDSLVEISATDLFFQHERSTVIASLVLALYAGSFIGPVLAGYIADSIGWVWCFYIQIIIYSAFFLFQLPVMEDTNFRRDENSEKLEEVINDQLKKSDVSEDMKDAITGSVVLEASDEESSLAEIPRKTYLQYSAEPYNFSTKSVGLTNLGILIGTIVGTFYGGQFVD
ncbi:hypothetical protein G210_0337, partial [Candida maltosa Xu316]